MRILYSFPYALGAPGVGTTAAQQVLGLAKRKHNLTVFSGSIHPGHSTVGVDHHTTMMIGGMRVPHRLLGLDRSMAFHDFRVAQHLRKNPTAYDAVHCWPGVSLHTARAAADVGLPSLREVPNTHTANAYEVVAKLCEELGVELPRGHSHRMNPSRLKREEAEYEASSGLLVPSDYVRSTFIERGIPPEKLLRHRYGFDPQAFIPAPARAPGPFHAIFLGTIEPRKGLHIALEAWRRSEAYKHARFSIYGKIVDGYRRTIESYLPMEGVTIHDFTDDPAGALATADALILPSFEEGSALVTYEAQGCGAVPIVSNAAGAQCVHEVTGMLHQPGDVDTLASHISRLINQPDFLAGLRAAVLQHRDELTWDAAAERLEWCYEQAREAVRSPA